MHDLTVIGAGPAGSLAALLLARLGYRVSVIEQHRFPRDKVCGECLSALGIEVLERAGLWPDLERLGAVRLHCARLHAADGSSAEFPLPRPMAGLSRVALDSFLLNAARDAGAGIYQPFRCESMELGQSPALRVRDLAANTVETWSPSQVIVADGKALGPNARNARPSDLGIKVHFANVEGPRDAIELFGCDDCYGGLAPIENSRWNAAFSVPAERVRRHKGDLGALFDELRTENKMLERRLGRAHRAGAFLASPLPRHPVRNRWPNGALPVGNSAAALEPIGGEGMGLALRSSELAAEMLKISRETSTPAQVAALRQQYQSLWQTRRVACRAAGRLASSQRGSAAGIRLINASAGLVRFAMHMIGK
jgi:flavin-dependent dehydrogenase